jgi:hypothetical protein
MNATQPNGYFPNNANAISELQSVKFGIDDLSITSQFDIGTHSHLGCGHLLSPKPLSLVRDRFEIDAACKMLQAGEQ